MQLAEPGGHDQSQDHSNHENESNGGDKTGAQTGKKPL
jgi:hypothetical protein